MRLRDLDDLPAVLTTAQVAGLTGICERTWWEVARGEAESSIDVTPIRVGRRGVLRWPTVPILAALGLGRADTALATSSPMPDPRDSQSNRKRPGRNLGATTVKEDRHLVDQVNGHHGT